MNPFKYSEPKATDIQSTNLDSEDILFDQFKSIRQKAIDQLLERENRIKAEYHQQIEGLQGKLNAELKEIHEKLKELGHIVEITPTSSKRRVIRKFHPPVSDEVLKQKLSTLLSGGRKVGSKEIFADLDISRPRFIAFLKNTGFLEITGSKKTTQYSLKA